jgi:hypothetical protein
MQMGMDLVTIRVVLNPMLAQTKLAHRPLTATDASTAMATSVLILTSIGCLPKAATHSLTSRLNGPMRTLMATATTLPVSHRMIARPFVILLPSTDLDALTPMVTAIRILMQRGQLQMVQMHASTDVETQPKTESGAMMKTVMVTQIQELTGQSMMVQMHTWKTRLAGLRKPLLIQRDFRAYLHSFTASVHLL